MYQAKNKANLEIVGGKLGESNIEKKLTHN